MNKPQTEIKIQLKIKKQIEKVRNKPRLFKKSLQLPKLEW